MAKGLHIPGEGGQDAAYVAYTGQVTRELRRAERQGRKVSVEVIFRHLTDYNVEGPEEQAAMAFFQSGYCSPGWLLERLQESGFRQYWREQAVESGRATEAGGVMRVTLRYHDKWSSTFQRRKSEF